ncbi:uncharacterized protein LOC112269395 [Brachypodium distachyon]|uniref:F-box domain-containing protein n=1 Tax=Brachypodium distachyon TaxID=15368 RepID=I1J286_BRADI|nr:uncharacterized protein LOC112269395 [Brachypodium distachyon]KQJ84805.1 hypothetical protein BRADI_5g22970v3 [Brachypodium distachyon]|eukprot:XP_024311853.1 uncharacterized protein LOC112269395 [Brachypodium distachyon]
MEMILQWLELPPELLGSIFSRLPTADDCACARTVCRSWRSAMRHHTSPARQLPPWVVLQDGSFMTSPQGSSHYRSHTFPDDARCVGSTDGWLALDCVDGEKRHSYLLHNPFSNTTVPLPELEAIIGVVPESFMIRKVLMRSPPDDIVVLMPNNRNHLIILVRPGKGVWLPKPHTAPFTYIVDVAFLGDILYGITEAEDLFSFDITFYGDGIPVVASIHHVIIKGSAADDNTYEWSNDDKDENDNNEIESSDKDKDDSDSDDVEGHYEDEDARDSEDAEINDGEEVDMDQIFDGIVYGEDEINTIWYFVESRGKLLMVRRQMQCPPYHHNYTRKVEVFQADVISGMWMPVLDGLDGQAIFISKPFCKSIAACKEIDEDTIHFIDTRDTFNMRSQIISVPQDDQDYYMIVWRFSDLEGPTWIFLPELVV